MRDWPPILQALLYALAMLAVPALLYAGAVLHRRLNEHLRRAASDASIARLSERCSCGYPLTDLDRVRCPECGRVFGFDATAEQLGLSDEQLRRAAEVRAQRRQPPAAH
jgi:hypothetical protein